MVSAFAEFERDLIVERTKLGLEKARRAGKHIGRPRTPRPPAKEVRAMKQSGHTWAEIAEHFRCTMWGARQAVKKGARKPGPRRLKN